MPSASGRGDQAWKPNLFVPGFPKCGTTALCDYLMQHPDIYVSKPKEPNTLAIGMEGPTWNKKRSKVVRPFTRYLDPEDYRRLFEEHSKFQYRAEGSQSYTLPPYFPGRLKQFAPGAKLLFMIREQKERLLSQYYHGFKVHLEPDFQRWTEVRFRPQVNLALFQEMLTRYHRLFGDSMRVIDNAALLRSPQKVMSEVFGFLGVKEVEVTPILSNVEPARNLNERQRRRAAPYLRLTKTVMTPARYFLDMADPGSSGRLRKPAGRLSLWKWFGVRARTATAKRQGSEGGDVIPTDLASLLDDDYAAAIEFCRAQGIMI